MKEKKERKLSKAELERKVLFEEKKEKLLEQGYTYKNLTLDVVYANVMSFVSAAPLVILLIALFDVVNKSKGSVEVTVAYTDMLLFLVAILLLTIAHELVHGFMWGLFAENHYKDISFGIIWTMMTPYCCCKSTLKRKQYILGGIMPTIVVGILPAVYAIVTCNYWVMLASLIMVAGGGADLIICMKMLFYRSESEEILFMDHPYECGFVVFEK